MKSRHADRTVAATSRWGRMKKPLLRYSLPAVTLPAFAMGIMQPEMDRSLPIRDSGAVAASYIIGYLCSLNLSLLAKRLENTGTGRLSELAARAAKVASWAGPIAVELAGSSTSQAWALGRSWPGLAVSALSAFNGAMTGRYMAQEGLVDNSLHYDYDNSQNASALIVGGMATPHLAPQLESMLAAGAGEFTQYHIDVVHTRLLPVGHTHD